jgi:hypothetical protein
MEEVIEIALENKFFFNKIFRVKKVIFKNKFNRP